MFPPVVRLGKHVLGDTTFKARRFTTSPDGKVRNVEQYTVPIKGGSMVIIDILALHMNREFLSSNFCTLSHVHSAIYWGDDVSEFRPERFIDTDTYRWPRDACVYNLCDCFNP
jgi:hypothetical protein